MPTYDRGSGTTSMRSEADARLDRPVRLEWSALFAGTLIGWGVLLVLSLIGIVLGLSVIDPFTARPAASNSGAALWGAVSAAPVPRAAAGGREAHRGSGGGVS